MKTPVASAWRLAVFLLVVLMIVILIVQAINRPVVGGTTAYRAEFTDVFGLRVNSDVRLRGVQVGKVTDIAIVDSRRALVTFDVQNANRPRVDDEIAIKFQNLTGQRYLAINPGKDSAPYAAPDIQFAKTVGSFDITSLFNGLAPIMKEADPAIYNRLARSMIDFIEGGGNDGDFSAVLKDVDTLAGYASSRTELLDVILRNMQGVANIVRGRASKLSDMLSIFHAAFTSVSDRIDQATKLVDLGQREFREIARAVNALSLVTLGGTDKFTQRVYEVIPDTQEAVRTLRALPAALHGLAAMIPETDAKCARGSAALPAPVAVLLSGRHLTICKR
ncbi:MlaD family protein [Gordonia sp. CPCC 205333]|uniref:MlaD family protein n=1 Tax=Gordonia sp. CPCC 205333 TaxID=3140790 RepID=UPI003AF38D4A